MQSQSHFWSSSPGENTVIIGREGECIPLILTVCFHQWGCWQPWVSAQWVVTKEKYRVLWSGQRSEPHWYLQSICPDCVPGRLLKDGAPWLSEALVALFNQSLQSGQFHAIWLDLCQCHSCIQEGNQEWPQELKTCKSYQHCGEDGGTSGAWENLSMSITNSVHLSMVLGADTHAKRSCWRQYTNGPTLADDPVHMWCF